ncbi:NRDE family protein [Paraburkholderia tagetis]|uniref:NRDE family protein n=1 Tax=Paraburkholderia tagetis TaxID=2913261 RepID=A0A9X1RK05_9BURK|nr:NRDE family protein [Paraburkholderia tagetis]MCG5073726.1 NRDE family protein [Paraburkholderia tagetis]
MCLIVFDWRPHATDGALFTLAANRDEFLRRATEPMQWWSDAPDVLAGRDLVGGGTWLGMTRGGRFAALTNYRAPHETRPDAPTRGTLVSRWLTIGSEGTGRVPDTPLDYLAEVAHDGEMYNGFNLVIGDWKRRELAWYCNRGDRTPALLPEGTHGISNAVLDTPWPKLVRKRAGLAELAAGGPDVPLEQLIELMRDPRVALDSELPATGIPLERERALSAAFIETPEYGTRGTTALRVRVNGGQLSVEAHERSDDDGSHRIARPGAFERHERFAVGAAR